MDHQPEREPEQQSAPSTVDQSVLQSAVRRVTRFGPRAMGCACAIVLAIGAVILYGFLKGPAAANAVVPENSAPPVSVTNHPEHMYSNVPLATDPPQTMAPTTMASALATSVPTLQPSATVPPQASSGGTASNPQDEARERLAAARAALENEEKNEVDSAIKSPILISEASGNAGGGIGGTASQLLADNGNGGGGNGQQGEHSYLNGPTGQFRSSNDGSRSQDILQAQREAPVSRYELIASSVIPATLITAIDTEHPGIISALVRQNVYDSLTGHYLLVPQGSRLLGVYEASIQNGQSRVIVAWRRLIFPDTTSIDLLNMLGADTQGSAGFGGKVDTHFGTVLKAAFLSTVLAVGVAEADPQTGSIFQYPTLGNNAMVAGAQQIQQVGSKLVANAASVPPTIHVTRGYPCNVIVDRDMTFQAPYSPQP